MTDSQVAFLVMGLPPTKNDALSLFNPTHGQHAAVIRLLDAASASLSPMFQPFTPVGIRVVVETTTGRAPADATNYLGGIADVLQQRGKSGLADRYGTLTSVAVFRDDGLIREVRYPEVRSAIDRYSVEVWPLRRRLVRLELRRNTATEEARQQERFLSK